MRCDAPKTGWRKPLLICFAAALAAAACQAETGEEPGTGGPEPAPAPIPLAETLSPNALPETTAGLRLDLETPRHPADGGGRAWIEAIAVVGADGAETLPGEAVPKSLRAASLARFDLVFEAGPLGVAEGGSVLFQVSPFWGWDTPQTGLPDAPGYTEVATAAAGVELLPRTLAETLLGIEIGGRALAAGERIRIRYGAGPLGARVDRCAERESRFWFGVDGDGDGVRGLLKDSPTVDIHAAAPASLAVTLPTTAAAGQTLPLRIAVLDAVGNAGFPFEGTIRLSANEGLELPEQVAFEARHEGRLEVAVRSTHDGIYRVQAAAEGVFEGLESESNPLIVRDGIERVLWADLHGHSSLSDGSGTPEDFMRYAREVAGLDVVALTDHDHWGLEFLDASPKLWQRIQAATKTANEPDHFVTLLGFEWTSWLHGHRHVLYFDDEGDVISSIDPDFETPAQLWDALAGKKALTFAHHSAGGPVATNWAYAPDPVLEPLTEIVSLHGSSESPGSPDGIYSPVAGNFVRDVLDRGYTLGLIGSSDSHDGHPGLAHLGAGSGSSGLAAILSESKTRDGVLAAMRARRVYATNGRRIWMSATLDGQPMGTIVTRDSGDSREHLLEIEVVGTSAIEAIDMVAGGAGEPGFVRSIQAPEGESQWSAQVGVPELRPGQYLYVRVRQRDGGAAWSSPFFRR